MKRFLTIGIILQLFITLQAQEVSDSIETQQLNEIVIEGLSESTSSRATTYLPSSKQKNASQNGYDLLYFMGIPQISINPMDLAVTDNTGSPVAIFINYMPASQEEMFGLYPEDVHKVEYLEFPVDPRFQGAAHVINILVQEYEYGGYTKATIGADLVAGFSTNANVFSKFSYKKMTFDLFAGTFYGNRNNEFNNAVSSKGIFNLKDNNETDFTLTRDEYVDKTHIRKTNYPVTLRATYNTEKIQIRNTLGFTHTAFPIVFQSGKLTFSPGLEESYAYERSNPNRSNSANYAGTFFFILPKNFSINASPKFQYSHNNNYLNYFSTRDESIVRNARENAYQFSVDAYVNKQFGQNHILMIGIRAGELINRLNYSGNIDYNDRYYISDIGGEAAYQFKTQNLNLYSSVGIYRQESGINGIKNIATDPYIHLQFRYSPNSQNSLSISAQLVNNTPEIDLKSSDVLQENEFLYITGNPLLKNSREFTLNVGYMWIHSNKFDLTAYAKYREIFKRYIRVYEPFEDGHALLRKYFNNGDFINGTIGVSASVKLLNNSLQFYLSPQILFYRSTGIYNESLNAFQCYAQATYYLNNFYFQAFYKTPDKSMLENAPAITKTRNFYGLIIGWGNSKWNLRLSAYNIFNKKWESGDTWISSPLYSEHKITYGDAPHARILFSATFTFGYGKKIQPGDEVGAQSGAGSAIIKN